MFRKNTASQFIHFQGVDATTGGIKSGVTWTIRRCIDGTFAAATGTTTEDGTTGWYKLAMSQADTNGNNIGFNFTGTGAVPQTVNIITTACDPTTATNFGITSIPTASAGASGGLLISGSNSGTTTLAALTVTGTLTISDGLLVSRSTANSAAATFTGTGSGNGMTITGGAAITTTAAGNGLVIVGGAASTSSGGVAGQGATITGGAGAGSTNGAAIGATIAGGGTNTVASTANGLAITGTSTGNGLVCTSGGGATGDGIQATSAATNGNGAAWTGKGSGQGVISTGGATGNGEKWIGGATSGAGLLITTTSGDGMTITPTAGNAITATANGTSKHGIVATGGTAGTSDGLKCAAGTGGVDIRGAITGNITGNLSGSVGSLTTNNDKTGYSLTQTFPTNFSAIAITAGGIVQADLQTIKTQSVTCAGGVTVPAATLASTTNITSATGVDITKILGTSISTPATAGILDVNVKNIKNATTAGAAGYAGIDWSAINAPTTAVNLSATQIQSVNNLASGSDSINTVATSGSTLTTGSSVSGTYASTAQLDGTYWQIADTAGTLDMYFEFNVGSTGVPTTAVWTGGLTTAVNTLKVYAYNWGGSSWDQIGTIAGTTSLIINNAQFDFTTSHVGTGGNIGLVRLRFNATGLTSSNFYTDQVLCGYTNVQTFPTNFSTFSIDSSGRVDIGKILGTASAGTAGYVGLDWGHIIAPTTTVDLSNTTIKNLDNAPSDSSGVTTLLSRLSSTRAGYLDNLSGGAVALASGVIVTTNNDKTGYSLTQAFPSNFSSLAITAGGATTVGTINSTAAKFKKNVAHAKFQFTMTDSTTGDEKTGLTVTGTVNIDGAGFVSLTNSVSELANGWYTVDLAAADLNGNNIALRFTATGATTRDLALFTQP